MENSPTSPPPSPSRSERAGEGEKPVALRKERLPLHVCQHLERLVGGDARTEFLVNEFIKKHFNVDCITRLPLPVAYEIMRRPADFLARARELTEPSLKL